MSGLRTLNDWLIYLWRRNKFTSTIFTDLETTIWRLVPIHCLEIFDQLILKQIDEFTWLLMSTNWEYLFSFVTLCPHVYSYRYDYKLCLFSFFISFFSYSNFFTGDYFTWVIEVFIYELLFIYFFNSPFLLEFPFYCGGLLNIHYHVTTNFCNSRKIGWLPRLITMSQWILKLTSISLLWSMSRCWSLSSILISMRMSTTIFSFKSLML